METAYTLLVLTLVAIIVIQLRFAVYLVQKDDRVTKAGHALYEATFWKSSEPNKLSAHTEDLLWQTLRDALKIAPGRARSLGVGDRDTRL